MGQIRTKGVWRWEELIEWDDAVKWHQQDPSEEYGDEIHYGNLFGLMVEKKELNSMRETLEDIGNTELYFKETR